jgi:hypothetical protein
MLRGVKDELSELGATPIRTLRAGEHALEGTVRDTLFLLSARMRFQDR